ncbi:MAG: hypothetical protein MUE46_12970 [Xanthomonadales bacterium]|jgi:hypothetical protein|nr:hypothetical protein [Xanthomonadales bacterium]
MSGARTAHGLALGVFGGLAGTHAPGGAGGALLGAVVATLGGLLLIGLLKGLLGAVNRGRVSDAAVPRSVDEAFVLLLPYALLAALAEGVLGWSAVQAFSSAGLMTAAGLAGAGAIAQGGKPWPNLLLPMLLVLPVAMGWMVLATLAGGWR